MESGLLFEAFVCNQMVILMDPLEDPDDILRANRSREKTYMFDVAFDYLASQVSPELQLQIKGGQFLFINMVHLCLCAGGGVQSYNQGAD